MYGYVVVNQPELKFREFDMYRSYYCGLCAALKDSCGVRGQISISYDMTFLVMLLSGLYEPETVYSEERCIAHPMRKHQVRRNEATEYVADMNMLMTYYKCIDDWNDERKLLKRTFAAAISRKVREIEKRYPKKAKVVLECMTELSDMEKRQETNIDRPAAQFGKILAEILLMREDEWQDRLRSLGDSLGRFIYILDAYDDMEKDEKKNNYNVLLLHKDDRGFDEFCESVLRSYMAQCARQFEMLPILKNAEIMRNIIYSGVWTRFEIAKAKRHVEDNND